MTDTIQKRRVVVTGLGIISCIGNDVDAVLASLKAGKSGITFSQEYADFGFRSQVHGKPDIDLAAAIDRRLYRFMGDAAGYTHLSMVQAVADAGLTPEMVSNERTGAIGFRWSIHQVSG
jgi:3-oxoacyl-[acyl-carrier-protein] synthase-1